MRYKKRLDDHTSGESLVKQITKIVYHIFKEECKSPFNIWIERMKFCKIKIKENILNIFDIKYFITNLSFPFLFIFSTANLLIVISLLSS